jgi:fucose permease
VVTGSEPAASGGGAPIRALPIFLAFFVMGFVDAVGTLVGFAKTEFSLTGAEAGLLPFFGFVAFALFSVPAGVLADRRGMRFLLLLSLGVVLAGQAVASLPLSSYGRLLGAILLIGVGMAALQVAGNPMMRDVSAPGRYARNLTFAQFLKSLGSISGPYLTALVVGLGLPWQRIFPVFAVVTLVSLLSALFVPAPAPEVRDRPASVAASFALLKEPAVALAVAGIFLYVGAEVGLNSWLATFLSRSFGMDLGSSATRLGLLLTGGRSAALSGIVLCGLGFANVWPLVFSLTIERRPESSGALSGLMCMAIFGGAALPFLMGLAADRAGVRLAFLVPLACFAYLTALAFADRRGGAA